MNTVTAAERIVDRLEKVKSTGANRWCALCPAHEDRTPSLSVTAIRGRVLLYCHAGCQTKDIVTAMGVRMTDLFDAPRELEYQYDSGRSVHRKYAPDGSKTFVQANTDRPVELFNLTRVREAAAAGRPVMICEGEEDARAAEEFGIVSTTSPMGAANWAKADYTPLIGAQVIVAVDNDSAGMARGRELAAHLKTIDVTVTEVVRGMVDRPKADIADHVAAGGTIDDLVTVMFDTEPDVPATTWEPLNVADLVARITAGTIQRTEPTVLFRTDGAALFYPGKVSGIHGDSGSGKTWTALLACAQVLAAGGTVWYIDLEDSPADLIGRLLALGTSPKAVSDRFRYIQPETPFQTGADGFLTMIVNERPKLVVIDSTGESLSIEGANPNADEDIAEWFRKVPKRIAKLGPAVLVLDHMPKSSDSDLWPIGSQRKRAAIDGAQYLQDVTVPFSRDKAGTARLTCAKDRHGNYARGQRVAILHVTPDADTVTLTLEAPDMTNTAGTFQPTVLMEKVSQALENAGPLTYRGILDRVGGKKDYVRQAVDELIKDGYVVIAPGPHNATVHTSAKPFRTGEQITPETTPKPGVTVPVP